MRPGIEDVVPVSHPNSPCGDRNVSILVEKWVWVEWGPPSVVVGREKKKKKQDLKSLPPLDAE